MQAPDLLLVDEPTASLDPKTSRQIMRLLSELCAERGLAAVINIHDVQLAQRFVQRVIGLRKRDVSCTTGRPTASTPDVLTSIYGEEDWTEPRDDVGEADADVVRGRVALDRDRMQSARPAMLGDPREPRMSTERAWSRPRLIADARLRWAVTGAVLLYLVARDRVGRSELGTDRARTVEKGWRLLVAFMHPNFTVRAGARSSPGCARA